MDIDSVRCVDKILDSMQRVLANYYFDSMRFLCGEMAADFGKWYSDSTGDWIADNGTDSLRFRSQIDAQAYAALRNSSSATKSNQYRAAYIPLPASDSNE